MHKNYNQYEIFKVFNQVGAFDPSIIKYNASDLIYQLLETNSYTVHNKSSEGQVKDLLVLYDAEFCEVSLYEKSLGADFIKRFFEICFRFKKNLFISLIQGDTKHVLEYELNENMLLKINENIETVLDYFQRVYDHIELNNTTVHEIEHSFMNIDGRKTIESFSELFENPFIFEEKENAKRLKDVFVWPEYRSGLLGYEQDDLKQVIVEFLKGNLKIFLYSKGVSKLKIDKDYNLLVILGKGGMGKSSLLEKLAYDIMHGAINLDANNVFFVKFSSMEYRYNNLLENQCSQLKHWFSLSTTTSCVCGFRPYINTNLIIFVIRRFFHVTFSFRCFLYPYLYQLKSIQKSVLIFGKITIDKLPKKCGGAP